MSGKQGAAKENQGPDKKGPERREQPELPAELDVAALASKGIMPGDLPNNSNSRSLRQASLIRLQRQQGNQFVQRYLAKQARAAQPLSPDLVSSSPAVSQGNTPTIQRGVEAGSGGAKIDLASPELAKEFPLKYAKAKLGIQGSILGELKPKAEHPGSVSVSDKGAKVSVNVYKNQAKAAGTSKFAQLAHAELEQGGWTVDKVDWEMGKLGVDESEEGHGEASVATGVKFTFKNGHEVTVDATLFKRSTQTGLEGPGLNVEPVLKFPEVKLWENKDAELIFSGEVKFIMGLKPNWAQIFSELAQKGGRAVARNFARAALEGMVEFLLGAGGFALGAVITVAAAFAEMNSISEIDECKKAARAAVAGYVHGWCISWGIEDFGTGGSEKWFYEGINDGRAKLMNMVAQIQAHPVFAPYNFTDTELRIALKQKLKTQPGAVYKQVEGDVKMRIYTTYVIEFYHKRKSETFTPTYIARKDAIWVARGLSVPESVVPEE